MSKSKKSTKKEVPESHWDTASIHYRLYQVDLEGKFKVKVYAKNEDEAKLEIWNNLCRAFDNRIFAPNPDDGGLDITGTTGIEEGHEDYIRSVWY